jgi:glycosyltransferase involved in cell wall biosynthesis
VRNDSKKSSKPLIGYFGRIKKYKSVDHLLKAFAIVLHKFPEAELVVVGEGDNRPELEKLTYSLNISNKVKFTGFVSEEEKVRLMQEVWYVVNPSSKEGWGLTVIEANACGTPVIASNVPGLRDAVRENETGLFYEYGNIEMLAEKMLRMLNDSELRQRLSNEAYTWSMNFNWEAVAQKTVELLQRTISNHKAA